MWFARSSGLVALDLDVGDAVVSRRSIVLACSFSGRFNLSKLQENVPSGSFVSNLVYIQLGKLPTVVDNVWVAPSAVQVSLTKHRVGF